MAAALFYNCETESIKTPRAQDSNSNFKRAVDLPFVVANFCTNDELEKAVSNANSDSKQMPTDAPERRRLPILLRRAWHGLNQTFRRRITHAGITPDQFTVLRTLLENEVTGLTQNELTKIMASDPNTIAALIARLEKAGLIRRDTHETDARAYRVGLKPAGKWKYEDVRDIAVDLQIEILSALPESRREQFLEDLALVGNAAVTAAEKVMKKRTKR